jgi:SEC-C motif
MTTKSVTLDLTAFLDSPQAAALTEVPVEDQRKIVGAFLTCCYDELGKAPRLMDDHDAHGVMGHLLPSHFKRKDPIAVHVPAVLRAYLEFLDESQVVANSLELRRGFEGTIGEFEETVRTGENAHHHHHHRQDPVVHQAPKTGRNDPCVCGSGKKFKKCCGKNS